MSLLLKALQNAAKNREAGAAGAESETSNRDLDNTEISLEPLQSPPRGTSTRAPSLDESTDRVNPGASPQHAQNVLRATTPVQRAGLFEWLARRPLVAFSTAAGLFAIGYGVYLYLQLTNPGIFVAQRPVTPPPAPGPISAPPPPPAPAPIAPAAVTAPAPLAPPPSDPALPGLPPIAQAPVAQPAPAPAPPVATAPDAIPPAAQPVPPAQTAGPPAAPARPVITVTAGPAEVAPAAARAPARAGGTPRAAPAKKPATGVAPATGPQVIPVDATLADAYQALERGQTDEAERLYRQALSRDPRSIDAMLGLAAALTQQNKGDAAGALYLRALEQDPRNAHAQAGLLSLGGRADPAAAETRLKQLIAREPSAFLHFTLGNLYSEQGQWAAAQGAYFQAHNLAPDNPDYAYNLAIGLEHVSQPKIALNYYRRAVALAQSRGHAQFELARVEARIRSLVSALAEQP